jgi:LacI family transcriptional regulator
MRASIKDVAARAGVSFQTASKVLNGKGSVSPDTRERIVGAAEELGYVPNALARSLKTRSTYAIGVVASDLGDFVLARFVVGVEREARRRGHAVIIGSIAPDGSDGERYLRTLIERRVDGVLMAAPQLEENARVGHILRDDAPAAVSIHHVPGGGIPLVGSDHARVGLEATRHLLEHGSLRVGTVTGAVDRRVTHSRLLGYRQALEEAGLGHDPRLVEEGDWGPAGGFRATCRLLEQVPDLDALFVQNDMMAVGALRALRLRGLRVPQDCAVIGCDDVPVAAYTDPPLTTMRVPFHETGEAAVRLLLDWIAERGSAPEHEPERILLPVRLVRRDSCGCGAAVRPARATEDRRFLGEDQD